MMLSCTLFCWMPIGQQKATYSRGNINYQTIVVDRIMVASWHYTTVRQASNMSCIRKFVIKLTVLWMLNGHIPTILSYENELYDCVSHIIHQHFPEECVCFFVDAKNHSLMFEKLIKEVGGMKSVYVVSSEDEKPVSIRKTKPVKPFPCYFIIDLPYVGSNMTELFLRGGYEHGAYNLNESRYLLVAEEHHTYQQAVEVLQEMFTYGFLDIDLVNPNATQVEILTLFPFGNDFKFCPEWSPLVLETVATWEDGSLDERLVMFPKKLPSGVFNGCAWNISCGFFTPYVMVDGLIVNQNPRFSGPLQGYDAGPLSMLMERLNLTPKWTIDIKNFWITEHENGTVSGAIPNLLLGRGAQMCCGGLYLTVWAGGKIDPTHFHTWATLSWFAAAPDKVPKWIMIFVALEKSVWTMVIVTSITVPIIYWIFCLLSKTQESLSQVFLTLTALGFSNGTGAAPINLTLRIVFLSWLLYTLHIDQFYLASLTRLITTAEYEPTIKTIDELLNSKLPTAAFTYTARSLNKSADPNILKLMDNSVPMTAVLDYYLNRMSLYKNFTIADNVVFVKYSVSLMNNVSIYPTQVTYQERTMSAFMWRHNYLFDRINWLLLRMFDAGFPVYFLKRTVPNRFWTNPNDNTARAFGLRDLSGPFHILIIGLFLSSVAFMSELLYFNRFRIFGSQKAAVRIE